MWPIVKSKTAKNHSKFHHAGDVYDVPDTLTKLKFQAMMKDKLIPAILEKVGTWADRVIVQIDSAGGHSANESTSFLSDYGQDLLVPMPGRPSKTRSIKIEFISQPTKSPDLNVLDLGAWNSLQSVVEECQLECNPTKKINHRLIDAVLKAWTEWESANKLAKLFYTLERVVKCVVRQDGGNQFNVRQV